MSDYIDLLVVGQVLGVGLLLGAGLPAVFAIGVRALASGGPEVDAVADAEGSGVYVTRSPAALALAVVCFLVVLAAVVYGVLLIAKKV